METEENHTEYPECLAEASAIVTASLISYNEKTKSCALVCSGTKAHQPYLGPRHGGVVSGSLLKMGYLFLNRSPFRVLGLVCPQAVSMGLE